MARTTPRLGLNVWDLTSDDFDHVELAANWDAVDAQIFVAKGFEILPTIPNVGNFPGRVFMLSSPDGGFRAWSLMRFDGVNWAPIGGIETHATLPINPYEGRIIILTGADGGFKAFTMLRFVGAEWRPIQDLSAYADNIIIGTGTMLNFVEGAGMNITAVDDAGNENIDITINADSSAPEIYVKGEVVGNRDTINIIEGTNMTFTITAESSEINITPNVTSPPSAPGTKVLDYAVYKGSEKGNDATVGWQEYDTNNLRFDFTVPTSGRVLFQLSAPVQGPFQVVHPQWGMTTGGGSLVSGTDIGLTFLLPSQVYTLRGVTNVHGNMRDNVVCRRLVTGLTPSANLTWYWAGNSAILLTNQGPATGVIFQVD